MKDQVNFQSLEEIKNLIEDNNTVLREAIQALKILSNQISLQEMPQQIIPQPSERHYPGYTTPPRFGFMGNI